MRERDRLCGSVDGVQRKQCRCDCAAFEIGHVFSPKIPARDRTRDTRIGGASCASGDQAIGGRSSGRTARLPSGGDVRSGMRASGMNETVPTEPAVARAGLQLSHVCMHPCRLCESGQHGHVLTAAWPCGQCWQGSTCAA